MFLRAALVSILCLFIMNSSSSADYILQWYVGKEQTATTKS